jgi:hypothetical protein
MSRKTTFDKHIDALTQKAISDSAEVISSALQRRFGGEETYDDIVKDVSSKFASRLEAIMAEQGQTDEFAWLVEAFGGQRDRYLAGFHSAYMGQGFAWMPTWTADHAQALRFAREADARKMADVMDPPSKCRAVEHGWMGDNVCRTRGRL